MIKKYRFRHPKKGEEQYQNIYRGISDLVNCSKYLRNQGFKENYVYSSLNGKFVFEDGSVLQSSDLCEDREDTLKEVLMRKPKWFEGYGGGLGDVLYTSLKSEGYHFYLSVINTTVEGFSFLNLFKWKPKKFAFVYDITLDKQNVSDSDIKSFENYKEGLERVLQDERINLNSEETKKLEKDSITPNESRLISINP